MNVSQEHFGRFSPSLPSWLQAAGSRRMSLVIGLSLVAAFTLLVTVPFVGQALHVDDALFWDFARNNLAHPLQQDLPGYHLMGQDVAAFRDTHPPIDELYMSFLMWVSGTTTAEAPLHIGFVVFPLMAGISMFFLGRRFTKNPLAAALLLLATPAMMVVSHTLMGDVPMTALWLAATAAYIYGVDRDDRRLLVLSSLLIALAVFTGYQALALLVLLPFYAWANKRLSLRTVAPLAMPVLAFAAFSVFNLAVYDALPRFSHARGLSVEEGDVQTRFQGMFLQIGGASVFPVFLGASLLLRRRRWLYLALPALAAALFGAWRLYAEGGPLASSILFVIFLTAGACFILGLLFTAAPQALALLRSRAFDPDTLFLVAWTLVLMFCLSVLLPHATAKYYLPFFAPLILLLMREGHKAIRSRRLFRGMLVTAVVLSAGVGLVLSIADYRLAQTYKDFALSFTTNHEAEMTGNVWFVGEWGFRHYMEAQGYQYLTSTSTAPQPGDIIVRPSLMDWPLDPGLSSRMELIEVDQAPSDFPIRMMDMKDNAGFYGTYWGELPFTISNAPVERFEIYRVA